MGAGGGFLFPIPPCQLGFSWTNTHHEDEEGPLGADWEAMDVQQEEELVVTVGAIVYTTGVTVGVRG